MIEFKDRLREAMDLRGLKQIDLANKTGINKSMISFYLSGRNMPNSKNVLKLARALNVSDAWLMGYEDYDISEDIVPEQRPESGIDREMSDLILKYITDVLNRASLPGKVELYNIIKRKEEEWIEDA